MQALHLNGLAAVPVEQNHPPPGRKSLGNKVGTRGEGERAAEGGRAAASQRSPAGKGDPPEGKRQGPRRVRPGPSLTMYSVKGKPSRKSHR